MKTQDDEAVALLGKENPPPAYATRLLPQCMSPNMPRDSSGPKNVESQTIVTGRTVVIFGPDERKKIKLLWKNELN